MGEIQVCIRIYTCAFVFEYVYENMCLKDNCVLGIIMNMQTYLYLETMWTVLLRYSNDS